VLVTVVLDVEAADKLFGAALTSSVFGIVVIRGVLVSAIVEGFIVLVETALLASKVDDVLVLVVAAVGMALLVVVVVV